MNEFSKASKIPYTVKIWVYNETESEIKEIITFIIVSKIKY